PILHDSLHGTLGGHNRRGRMLVPGQRRSRQRSDCQECTQQQSAAQGLSRCAGNAGVLTLSCHGISPFLSWDCLTPHLLEVTVFALMPWGPSGALSTNQTWAVAAQAKGTSQ